ncbi:unnamed protein product [Dovyalis caffra]|uniref:Secreted protein n=1 Tax=Dovyalis caffra TaxID=77055 RepID=A0AAV1RCQ0_9ROSI|nr:unnamed protein product [Dovyalis caffra]
MTPEFLASTCFLQSSNFILLFRTFTIGASRLHRFGASGLSIPANKTQKIVGWPPASGICRWAYRHAGGRRVRADVRILGCRSYEFNSSQTVSNNGYDCLLALHQTHK